MHICVSLPFGFISFQFFFYSQFFDDGVVEIDVVASCFHLFHFGKRTNPTNDITINSFWFKNAFIPIDLCYLFFFPLPTRVRERENAKESGYTTSSVSQQITKYLFLFNLTWGKNPQNWITVNKFADLNAYLAFLHMHHVY